MTEPIEFVIVGNINSEYLIIEYRHTDRTEEFKKFDIVELPDNIKIVDTKRYGYRFYDKDTRKFISKKSVMEEILNKAQEKISEEFNGLELEIEGDIDLSSGEADFHGSYP